MILLIIIKVVIDIIINDIISNVLSAFIYRCCSFHSMFVVTIPMLIRCCSVIPVMPTIHLTPVFFDPCCWSIRFWLFGVVVVVVDGGDGDVVDPIEHCWFIRCCSLLIPIPEFPHCSICSRCSLTDFPRCYVGHSYVVVPVRSLFDRFTLSQITTRLRSGSPVDLRSRSFVDLRSRSVWFSFGGCSTIHCDCCWPLCWPLLVTDDICCWRLLILLM